MIPVIVAAGYRAVAPDLIGFGRSDKPAERSDYSYRRHVAWTYALLEKLALTDIRLVCQDWGGLIGLRIVGEHPERFARVVAANTGLPTGDQTPGDAFLKWREFSQQTPTFDVGSFVQAACVSTLPAAVVAAYNAPFPDDSTRPARASSRPWC